MINLILFEKNKTSILESNSRILQFATMSFDVSYQEIFSSLLSGNELILISDEKRKNVENLVEYMKSIKKIESIPDLFFSRLEEKLKAYFIVGGMPEVVYSWVTEKNMEKVNKLQSDILTYYESDFSKHISNSEATKISLIWNGMPSQLSKENKKFLYQTIKEGARAREYENALNWLNDANLIYKVYNVKKNSIPLKAYTDLSSFKIYLN